MPTDNAPAGLISPTLFDQYTAKWLAVVSDPTSPDLAPSFLANGDNRLLLVRFPLEWLVSLLSTVNIACINTRFLLVPGDNGAAARFAVALFAADEHNERLSAYYIADDFSTVAPTPPTSNGGVPTELAAVWLAKWQEAAQITPAMFATAAGPLQGYNFELKDFLDPLLAYKSFDGLELHLSFGLHEYHAASPESKQTQTFGLLLRVLSSQQTGGGGYYDMSLPCPPGGL